MPGESEHSRHLHNEIEELENSDRTVVTQAPIEPSGLALSNCCNRLARHAVSLVNKALLHEVSANNCFQKILPNVGVPMLFFNLKLSDLCPQPE